MPYVSQTTYDQGTPEQQASWTVDPTIIPAGGYSGASAPSGGTPAQNAAMQQTINNGILMDMGFIPTEAGWVSPSGAIIGATTSEALANLQSGEAQAAIRQQQQINIQGAAYLSEQQRVAQLRQTYQQEQLGRQFNRETAVAEDRARLASGLGYGTRDVPESVWQAATSKEMSEIRAKRQAGITESAEKELLEDTKGKATSTLYSGAFDEAFSNLSESMNTSIIGGASASVFIPNLGTVQTSVEAPEGAERAEGGGFLMPGGNVAKMEYSQEGGLKWVESALQGFPAGMANAEGTEQLVGSEPMIQEEYLPPVIGSNLAGGSLYSNIFTAPSSFKTAKWLSDEQIKRLSPAEQVGYYRSIGISANIKTEQRTLPSGEIEVIQYPEIGGIYDQYRYQAASPVIQKQINEMRSQGFYGVQAATTFDESSGQYETKITAMGRDMGALIPMTDKWNIGSAASTFLGALSPVDLAVGLFTGKPSQAAKIRETIGGITLDMTSYYSSRADTSASQIIEGLQQQNEYSEAKGVYARGDIIESAIFGIQNRAPMISDVASPYKVSASMKNLANSVMQAANTQLFISGETSSGVPAVVKESSGYSIYHIPTTKEGNVFGVPYSVPTSIAEPVSSFMGSPGGTALTYAAYIKGFQYVVPAVSGFIGGVATKATGGAVSGYMGEALAQKAIGTGILGYVAYSSGVEGGTLRNPQTGEVEATSPVMGAATAIGTLGAFRAFENIDYSLQAKEPLTRFVQSPSPFKISSTPIKRATPSSPRTVQSDVFTLSYEGFPYGGYGKGTNALILGSATTGVGRFGRSTKFSLGGDYVLPRNMGKVLSTWSVEGAIESNPTTTTIRESGIMRGVVPKEDAAFYFSTKPIATMSEGEYYRLTDYETGRLQTVLSAREKALMDEAYSPGTEQAALRFFKSNPDIVIQGSTQAGAIKIRTPAGEKPLIDRAKPTSDIDAALQPGVITTLKSAFGFEKAYSMKSSELVRGMNAPEDSVVFFKSNDFQVQRMRLGYPMTTKAESLYEPMKYAEILTPESGAQPAEIQNFGIRNVRTVKSKEGIKMTTPGQEVIQSGSRMFQFSQAGFKAEAGKEAQSVGDFYIKALRTAQTIRNPKARAAYIAQIQASYQAAPARYKGYLQQYANQYYAPEFETLGVKQGTGTGTVKFTEERPSISIFPASMASVASVSILGSASSVFPSVSLSSKASKSSSFSVSSLSVSQSSSSKSPSIASVISSFSTSKSSPSVSSSKSSKSSSSSSGSSFSSSVSRSISSMSSPSSRSSSSSSSYSRSFISITRVPGWGMPMGAGMPLGSQGFGMKIKAPRKQYTPDLTAAFFGITRRGRAPKENVGFGIQPIFLGDMKPRKATARRAKAQRLKQPDMRNIMRQAFRMPKGRRKK